MPRNIPLKILRKAAQDLIPGPEPSASDVKHGRAKSKLKLLRDLVAADPEWRRKVKEYAADQQRIAAHQALAARGYPAEPDAWALIEAFEAAHIEGRKAGALPPAPFPPLGKRPFTYTRPDGQQVTVEVDGFIYEDPAYLQQAKEYREKYERPIWDALLHGTENWKGNHANQY